MNIQPISLKSSLKKSSSDMDKTLAPEETLRNVRARLAALDMDIVAGTRRIDSGRLDIPVYISFCGGDARAVMPTRKQMGKGPTPAQAEASALMELMERFAFFSFWQNPPRIVKAAWSAAEKLFGPALLPLREMLLSVNDKTDEAAARRALDTREWLFYPATRLDTGAIVWLPLDWFKTLNEFNGASAGNSAEESLMQGLCELVERHVCAVLDKDRPVLPTINPDTCEDARARRLVAAFRGNGINLLLKDFSLGMPLPTVGVLAWDPATFPEKSEIVFTAGTATSPLKAAIRAMTEAAQLGGDFNSGSCYEASGLPKFATPAEAAWLEQGPVVNLADLPDISARDILDELKTAAAALAPIHVYAVDMTHPNLGIPAHYCVAPGLAFRERDKNQSLGLFIGRMLVEEDEPDKAAAGLSELAALFPKAHYISFFRGMLALRRGDYLCAAADFQKAIAAQPDDESRALAAFYQGYALTLAENWDAALEPLQMAARLSPGSREYANLLGVALFRAARFTEALACFEAALKIDKGSAMDLANRGICHARLGHADQAARDLAAALELDPSLDFARKQLADLARGSANA